jgi:periplasmic divalent cation tolerance protein
VWATFESHPSSAPEDTVAPPAATATTSTSRAVPAPPLVSVLLSTAPSEEEAKRLAKVLVQSRLAACVNIVPKVTSVYEWEGNMEESAEAMMVIKVSYM